MRKTTLSIVALIALSSQSYAGGDILPVEAYKVENIVVEVEPAVKEIKKEVKAPLAVALLENNPKIGMQVQD